MNECLGYRISSQYLMIYKEKLKLANELRTKDRGGVLSPCVTKKFQG